MIDFILKINNMGNTHETFENCSDYMDACKKARKTGKGIVEYIKSLIEKREKLSNKAIWWASMCGPSRLSVIILLTGYKKFRDIDYNMACELASFSGNLKLVEFLIENFEISMETMSRSAREASRKGHIKVVQYLSEKGADVSFIPIAEIAT